MCLLKIQHKILIIYMDKSGIYYIYIKIHTISFEYINLINLKEIKIRAYLIIKYFYLIIICMNIN